MKVDKFVKGAVRQFAYWFAHGTIGSGQLNGLKTLAISTDWYELFSEAGLDCDIIVIGDRPSSIEA